MSKGHAWASDGKIEEMYCTRCMHKVSVDAEVKPAGRTQGKTTFVPSLADLARVALPLCAVT